MADSSDVPVPAFPQVYSGRQDYEYGTGYFDVVGGSQLYSRQTGIAKTGKHKARTDAISFAFMQGSGIVLTEALWAYFTADK